MEIIEDIAIVKEVKGKKVLVMLPEVESCHSCSMRGLCNHSGDPGNLWLETEYALMPGDKVKLFISPALRIASSFAVFLVPVLLMLAFYLASKYLLILSENISILIAILSLGASGMVIWLLDKKWSNRIKFEIIEVIEANNRAEEVQNEDQAQ